MYESVEVMHALFDKHSASNKWIVRSRFLKETVEYFSVKTEQLDIYHEDGKVTFLSFTDKITGAKNGKC
jgi:cell cycle checkpoint control protein RAD9A